MDPVEDYDTPQDEQPVVDITDDAYFQDEDPNLDAGPVRSHEDIVIVGRPGDIED